MFSYQFLIDKRTAIPESYLSMFLCLIFPSSSAPGDTIKCVPDVDPSKETVITADSGEDVTALDSAELTKTR